MPEGTIKNIDPESYNKAIQDAIDMIQQMALSYGWDTQSDACHVCRRLDDLFVSEGVV